MALGFKKKANQAEVDAYNAKLKAAAQQDPQLATELTKQAHHQPFNSDYVLSRLRVLGLNDAPEGSWISGGQATQEPTNPFWTKALPLMGAAVAGGLALPALAGGGAAGGAGAAGAAGAGGAGTTAATTGSLFGGLMTGRDLINAGTNVAGTLINAHAQGKAADREAEAADKALQLQREMWEKEYSDLAPYRKIGTDSLSTLSHLMGFPAQSAPQAAPMAGTSPTGTPSPTQTPQMAAGMVKVQSPTGQVGLVPQDKLQAALAAGGRQV